VSFQNISEKAVIFEYRICDTVVHEVGYVDSSVSTEVWFV